MQIKKIEPRVITYALRSESNDEGWQCAWAKFIFDCDSGQLNINSDAGDYSYRWGYNKNEDFMDLMKRIGKAYLLDKIADCSVFNLEASKKEMIKTVKEYAIPNGWCKDGKSVASFVKKIKEIERGSSEETYYRSIEDLFNFKCFDWESIIVVNEYPAGAKVVVDLFEKYVQPQIKLDAVK